MLPDANNSPTGLPEVAISLAVPLDVPGDFVLPVGAVVSWHAQMPSATVPKTAVHEDGESLATEDEIGLAGQPLVSAPAGDALGTENGGEPQLGGPVSGGPDGGHDLRSLFLCEHVSHRPVFSTWSLVWELPKWLIAIHDAGEAKLPAVDGRDIGHPPEGRLDVGWGAGGLWVSPG